MLTRRILPCLNVIDGRVKKRLLGSERLLDVGDPVELAFKYQENGTDGLVFITDPKVGRRWPEIAGYGRGHFSTGLYADDGRVQRVDGRGG